VTRAETDDWARLEPLKQQLDEARRSQDYAAALGVAEQIHELVQPPYVESLYRLASLHAALGHEEQAYEWLGKTLDAGYWDFRRLLADDDFKNLRESERFRSLVRGAWTRQYLAMLERPERDEFQKPQQVLETLAFRPGERVADIGAGSGYFTIPAARAVGPEGVVWAIDIRQEMLDHIAGRLATEPLKNVRLMLVDPEDPQLPDGRVDTILMVDTLHYVKDRVAYARKLAEGLAPGGRVVIIDYRPKPWEERPWGPPPEQQVPIAAIDADMATAGLKPIRVHDFLPEQYFVEYGRESDGNTR